MKRLFNFLYVVEGSFFLRILFIFFKNNFFVNFLYFRGIAFLLLFFRDRGKIFIPSFLFSLNYSFWNSLLGNNVFLFLLDQNGLRRMIDFDNLSGPFLLNNLWRPFSFDNLPWSFFFDDLLRPVVLNWKWSFGLRAIGSFHDDPLSIGPTGVDADICN